MYQDINRINFSNYFRFIYKITPPDDTAVKHNTIHTCAIYMFMRLTDLTGSQYKNLQQKNSYCVSIISIRHVRNSIQYFK